MEDQTRQLVQLHGRGTATNPINRFEQIGFEPDLDELLDSPAPRTRFFRDTSRKAIASNDSPDVGFSFSVNPYRGCEHGCIYCYARPGHEYLGLSAGLDFETKIFVKGQVAELLRQELSSPRWVPATVAMSGVTDCYQPIERKLELTRRCIEVFAEFRNPMTIITKNHLVSRDVDLLSELASDSAASVTLSITSLDPELQRVMEPRTSSPALRLDAISRLAAGGVPVGVMIGPVIPGLTDHEIPAILRAASDAGAGHAGYIALRLPHAVKVLFEEWLETHFPDRKEKVIHRIREIRGGKLYDSRYGSRLRGEGKYADHMNALFDVSVEKFGLNRQRKPLSTAAWRGENIRSSRKVANQLSLF